MSLLLKYSPSGETIGATRYVSILRSKWSVMSPSSDFDSSIKSFPTSKVLLNG